MRCSSYERFLGRPFAGHRDSVSELVGDIVESAIEDVVSKARRRVSQDQGPLTAKATLENTHFLKVSTPAP
jgi:hypothetical protein